jgi:5-methylcytosine-specific restriction endonuclease McrBC GTP-binding regulatory subunit McrB
MLLKNNFDSFKQDFQNDTGLKPNENLSLYIQYYNARVADIGVQYTLDLLNNIYVKIDQLPSNTRLAISEMLRTHEVIKQIIEK